MNHISLVIKYHKLIRKNDIQNNIAKITIITIFTFLSSLFFLILSFFSFSSIFMNLSFIFFNLAFLSIIKRVVIKSLLLYFLLFICQYLFFFLHYWCCNRCWDRIDYIWSSKILKYWTYFFSSKFTWSWDIRHSSFL